MYIYHFFLQFLYQLNNNYNNYCSHLEVNCRVSKITTEFIIVLIGQMMNIRNMKIERFSQNQFSTVNYHYATWEF